MDKFEQLLAQLAPEIARAFREAIQTVVDDAVLKDVIRYLEVNDVDGAFRVLGVTEPVYNPLIASLQQVFMQGGQAGMLMMPRRVDDAEGISTVLRFNIRDQRAEQWLAQESSTLVTNITADVRTAVQSTLQAGLSEGRNPRSIALDIVGRIDPATGKRSGGVIGLGDREQMWARNARNRLLTLDESYFTLKLRDKRFDGTVQRAIEQGQMLPISTVDKLMDRYRDNALRYRGEQIGRSEALAALNRSERLSVQQALETSGLPKSAATKIWEDSGLPNTRHSHKELDGQEVGIDEPFVSPVTGALMMQPGDTSLGAPAEETVGCRCHVRYKINFALRSKMENERRRMNG